MGQKTQPTVSKHWRKRSPKDQDSIPLGPPHCADNNTTYMQYEKNTKYTQMNTIKSWLCTVKCTQCDKNPIQRTVRTAHLSVLMIVHICPLSTVYSLITSPVMGVSRHRRGCKTFLDSIFHCFGLILVLRFSVLVSHCYPLKVNQLEMRTSHHLCILSVVFNCLGLETKRITARLEHVIFTQTLLKKV